MLDYGKHSIEGNPRVLRSFLVNRNLVDHNAFVESVENSQNIGRVNTIHGGAWADYRIQAEDCLVRIFGCQTVHHAYLSANRDDTSGRGIVDHFQDVLGRATGISRLYHFHRAFRMNHNVYIRILGACLFDLLHSESCVN